MYLVVFAAVAAAGTAAATTAAAAEGYSPEALTLRLRRLEEENAALREAAAALRRAMPRCIGGFVQTGGCDPDGTREQSRPCDELIPSGMSGYCECRANERSEHRFGCDHAPLRCADLCGEEGERAPAGDWGSAQVAIGARGQVAAAALLEGC